MATGDFIEYNIGCVTEGEETFPGSGVVQPLSKYIWSTTPPTVCPTNAAHTVDPTATYVLTQDLPEVGLYHYLSEGDYTAGTVMSVSPATNKAVQGFGAVSQKFIFDDRTAGFCASAQMNSTQAVIVYSNALLSNRGYLVVATTNGTTITYGEPVLFSNTDTVLQSLDIAMVDAATFIIVYRNQSPAGRYVIGVMSGVNETGTASVSLPATFFNGNIGDVQGTIKVVVCGGYFFVAFRHAGSSPAGRIYYSIGYFVSLLGIATVVTWLSAGAITSTVSSPIQNGMNLTSIDDSRCLIVYENSGMKARIITVSGLLILATATLGVISSIDVTNTTQGRDMAVGMSSVGGGAIVCRRNVDNNTVGRITGFTVSGAGVAAASQALTLGTSQNYTVNTGIQTPSIVKTGEGQLAIVYLNGNNNNSAAAAIVSQTGSTITVTSTDNIFSTSCLYLCASFVNGVVMSSYRDLSYNSLGVSSIFSITSGKPNLVANRGETPIGILTQDCLANSSAQIKVFGPINVYEPGTLLVGKIYFAHGDGTISTSNAATDGSYVPLRLGIAVRTTTLNITF